MSRFTGRTVLVTGAAGGLGRAVAHRFAAEGATVMAVDVNGAAAEEAARAIASETGAQVESAEADITSESALLSLRETVHDRVGPVDTIANVAGILSRLQMADLDGDAFRKVLDVNLTGTYLVTRVFSEDLVARGWGRVINTASIAATRGYAFPAYGASKAGVVNLTKSLLLDFWGTGITVNAVCPGAMETPMLDQTNRENFQRKTPTARIVTPTEVAAAFAFLASDEASSINGQALVVDGGATEVFNWYG
ncbi:SDR family NAD(P)-dependent oxidoreductase [Streptomyces sp. NPDC002577]